jgi:hypothetical protein
MSLATSSPNIGAASSLKFPPYPLCFPDHSGCLCFKSQQWHHICWVFSWFSLVSPLNYRNGTPYCFHNFSNPSSSYLSTLHRLRHCQHIRDLTQDSNLPSPGYNLVASPLARWIELFPNHTSVWPYSVAVEHWMLDATPHVDRVETGSTMQWLPDLFTPR